MISPLLRDFACALEKDAITYCHWKGNYQLATDTVGSAAVAGDFDILIERHNWPSAINSLTALNFKLALPRWSRNTPAMLHYFGFDSAQQKLVHVHLHSVIISGENFIDSHCYPFTQLLLQHTHSCNGFRVPGRGAELLIYVLKVYIRFGSAPDLLMHWLKPKSTRRELQWLQKGSAEADAIALLREYFPTLEEPLFRQCLQLLNQDSGSLTANIRLARRVRKRLRIWSRFTIASRLRAYLHVFGARVQRVLNATPGSKMLASGGVVISVVGPPASSSVLLANLTVWLSGKLIVRSVDATQPPSSWLTLPVNALLPVLRKSMPGLRAKGLVSQTADASGRVQANTLAALLYALRAVCFAKDRQHMLLATRRAAANGWVVFCYHCPAQANAAIDGPLLRPALVANGVITKLYEWLRQCELGLCQQNCGPAITIRLCDALHTDKQHAIARSVTGESRAANPQQHERLNAAIDCVVEKNSGVPAAATILRVKNIIWQAL